MYEGKYTRIWTENNILFLEYRPNLILDLNSVQHVLAERLVFQQNKEYAVFCDPTGIISADNNAMDFLSQEGCLLIKAIAFYVQSPLPVLLTEYYIKTHIQKVPAEIFKNKFQAINYLLPYSK